MVSAKQEINKRIKQELGMGEHPEQVVKKGLAEEVTLKLKHERRAGPSRVQSASVCVCVSMSGVCVYVCGVCMCGVCMCMCMCGLCV